MAEKYVIIHGHFYQPSRANPWLGVTLAQETAEPYNDWNEKIFSECYQPNAAARVLNSNGFTLDIVNNYEYISFDFGPTLVDWLKKTHAKTWSNVTEADRLSQKLLNHGNAVACTYSHTILPLDSPFLKKLDIQWGLKSFETSFGRKAEGLWLPETAVNEEVIDELITSGMKYVLLVSTQVSAAHPMGIKHEIDVSSGNIDPRYPYKIKTDKGEITAFIAHREMSQAISFENILFNSHATGDRIESAFSKSTHHDQVVTILSDGETFGHHQPFAERGLAHLLKYELPLRGIKVVNPGYLAEKSIGSWEIRIKDGKEKEGTSWSCAHGVDRWRDDCGCGKEPGTSQKWRAPLREAFDFLAKNVHSVFNSEIKKFIKEPEGAIADYPEIIDDYSLIDAFMEKHRSGGTLTFDEKRRVLMLFEMLKNTLFTFTSCGWFWANISGLEPVHNMACAARALDIYKGFSGENIEEKFLKILEKAPTNPPIENGRRVYERFVNPQKMSRYIYIAGCIIRKLALNPDKTETIDNPFWHIFINSSPNIVEAVVKSTEEKMHFDYTVTDGEFPYAINLKSGEFSGDFTISNVSPGARNLIMIEFWMKKIRELKNTYNTLLDYFLGFESVYRYFKKAIKEIEPVIAKVLMYQLIEIEEEHSTESIQVVKSLVQIVKEHNLNLDGFYTRECLRRSIDKELGRFIIGDFQNIEFLSVLFDIYFLISSRTMENIYHSIIFRKIKTDGDKIKSLTKAEKQFLVNICINFRISPALVI
ncbi:MAG: hypothetical protein COT16_01960 [Elusimicrobia bacterium CG08_land_8_20_14_0_20_44_26]|nr:MAG: hypothetical protein COT16_01960 [Elusimicrobia bacterium CG08_land_8_20_14_0_20_44_26]